MADSDDDGIDSSTGDAGAGNNNVTSDPNDADAGTDNSGSGSAMIVARGLGSSSDAGTDGSGSDASTNAQASAPGGVTIQPPFVACPGHVFPLKAVGSPPGGSYSWSLLDTSDKPVPDRTAAFVDASGNGGITPATDSTYLLSFAPDNLNGTIPQYDLHVTVTYTHPNGKWTNTQTVSVHGISFDVTNDTPTSSPEVVRDETAAGVQIWRRDNTTIMACHPKVTINIGAACPQPDKCAKNHRAGWIQTMTNYLREADYGTAHWYVTTAPPPPIRDAYPDNWVVEPFMDHNFPFNDTMDTQIVNHDDSPKWWDTPLSYEVNVSNSKSPNPKQLKHVNFALDFTAWLVVQNVEQYGRSATEDSLVFLRNFDWSVNVDSKVDMSKPLGSRFEKTEFQPTVSPVGTGKGQDKKGQDKHPKLDGPIANNNQTWHLEDK